MLEPAKKYKKVVVGCFCGREIYRCGIVVVAKVGEGVDEGGANFGGNDGSGNGTGCGCVFQGGDSLLSYEGCV